MEENISKSEISETRSKEKNCCPAKEEFKSLKDTVHHLEKREYIIFFVVGGIAAGIFAGMNFLWKLGGGVADEVLELIKSTSPTAFIVSMIVLTLITYFCGRQVHRVFGTYKNERLANDAMMIAVILGLVAVTIIFYVGPSYNFNLGKVVLFFTIGFSFFVGFFIWLIVKRQAYVDFLHIFLMIVSMGICWYARFFGSSEQQMVIVSFIVGSLVFLARDRLAKFSND